MRGTHADMHICEAKKTKKETKLEKGHLLILKVRDCNKN